jgi:hypothetical protein
MASLSISQAWDETKARLAADGKLIGIVAAALIGLPGLVQGVFSLGSAREEESALWMLLVLVSAVVAIIGQLAIIRLAIRSSVSVGESIAHGARRMPIYFIAGLLIAIVFALAAIPFAGVLVALGIPLERSAIFASGVGLLVTLLYFAVGCFIGIRMLMSSPVASEEDVGPVAIIKRTWALTSGHFWRLFGFLLLFLLGAGIAISVVNWGTSLVAVALLGPIEKLSASALVVAIVNAILNAVMSAILAVMIARIYVQLAGLRAGASVPKSGT